MGGCPRGAYSLDRKLSRELVRSPPATQEGNDRESARWGTQDKDRKSVV